MGNRHSAQLGGVPAFMAREPIPAPADFPEGEPLHPKEEEELSAADASWGAAHEGPAPQPQNWRLVGAGVAALATAGLACAVAGGAAWRHATAGGSSPSTSRPRLRRAGNDDAEVLALASGADPCSAMLDDVDFWSKSSLTEFENVFSADDCRSRCAGYDGCGAWSWGKQRDVPGLTDLCFLMALEGGEAPQENAREGIVSGLACSKGLGANAVGATTGTTETTSTTSSTSTATGTTTTTSSSSSTSPLPEWRRSCGEVELGIDYQTWAPVGEIAGVKSAFSCRVECLGTAACVAWTWGEARDMAGMTDVCFLKGLQPDREPVRQQFEGVVSGTLCADREIQHEWSPSSLYCLALMLPGSYEQGLLAMQLERQVSLFACDAYSVYSNRSVELAAGFETRVIDSDLRCEMGGEFGTALNLDIFVVLWKKVIEDGDFGLFGWTVKVDPDSVFFPSRLRTIVEEYSESPQGAYINNCKYGLHGPIEVFSRNAVVAWGDGMQQCLDFFNDECSGSCFWGEDMFVDQCFIKVLHLTREESDKLLLEEHCDPPVGWEDCQDGSFVSYHPFKTQDGYQLCLDAALEAAAEAV